MSAFSDYLEQKLLGVTLLGSPFTAIQTTWLSLATSIATDGASYTEVTTDIGYGRRRVTWSDPTSGPTYTCINSETVSFSPATTPWGTVAHWAIFDSEDVGSGNMLYSADFDSSAAVNTGSQVTVAAGNLKIRLD